MAGGNGGRAGDFTDLGGTGGTAGVSGGPGNGADGGNFGTGGGGGGAGAPGGTGGGGFQGAVGGAGGQNPGDPGSNGAGYAGGGGGAGGTTLTVSSPGILNTTTTGGTGGAGGAATAGGNGTSGGGGGGGEGGYGVIVTAGIGFVGAVYTGGTGGAGGPVLGTSGRGGNGGDGGVGGSFNSGADFTIGQNGGFAGGSGGVGGASGFVPGTGGSGGVGLVGASLTVHNAGSITGGLSNAGVQADAIDFTGGANSLYLVDNGNAGSISGGIGVSGSLAFGPNGQTYTLGTGNIIHDYVTGASGSISLAGTGTLILGAANTYTGTTNVNLGVLNIRNATALGTTAAGTTVAFGAALQLQGSIAVGAEALQLSGTGTGNGGALDSVSGINSYAGAITLAAASRINVDADNLLLTGGISGNAAGRTLTLGGAGSGGIGTNAITAVTGGLVKDGVGSWTLYADNTYTGGTTISGGTLQIGNGGTIGSVAGDIVNNAALAFNRSNDLNFSGVISGTGILQKLGAGVLTLTNVDTYTGATIVSGGTLLVNGSIANSATNVLSGGTLGGSGTAGAVTVASGGFLSPGNSPGLLHTGDLALANGATYVEQIGGTVAGTQYDQTDVTGTVNLNGGNAASGATLNVTAVNGFTPVAGQTYVIINNDGNDAVQGTFAGLAEGATVTVNGVNLVISYRGGDGNDVTLTDPVPYSPPSGPTAVSDTANATFGTALIKAAPGVLTNDSGAGGALTVTAVNGQAAAIGKAVTGAYGSLTLNGDGSYTYTPDATKTVFTGSVVDHFTYTDTANGQTATASLDITVAPPPASTLALFGTVVTNSASQTGSVYALYEGLLGRAPDALGLEGFSASLQAGAKLTDVASAILGSAEHGPAISDPTSYVQSLYANTLHRAADGGGLTYYTNELNAGVSQATVAVQIASSTEAQQVNAPAFSTGVFVTDAIDAGVARLYYGLLGRTPDAGGLQAFEAQVKQAAAGGGVNGAIQGLANAANAMLGSQEYGATHAGQTNAAFVDSLFVGALGRHADAGGAAFYANELSHGVSQAQVALQIAESPEAQVHLVGQIELGWHLA